MEIVVSVFESRKEREIVNITVRVGFMPLMIEDNSGYLLEGFLPC